MRAFFEVALQELQAGRRVFACFVAANKKGSPGTPAARLLLMESGRQVGTIGGGVMELTVIQQAAELLSKGSRLSPQLEILHHHQTASGQMSGLFCGGQQSNVSLILEGAQQARILSDLLALERDGHIGILKVNTQGIALEVLQELPVWSNSLERASGNDWSFSLNLVNLRRIAIFGGGHCGVALAEQMLRLGYAVTLVESRPDVFTMCSLNAAVTVLEEAFESAADKIDYPDHTLCCVMTHSFQTDVLALSALLKRDFGSVGVMGSQPKIMRIRESLLDQKFDYQDVERVRAPVGLPCDSDTPEEIAVSIAAQILLERENEQ